MGVVYQHMDSPGSKYIIRLLSFWESWYQKPGTRIWKILACSRPKIILDFPAPSRLNRGQAFRTALFWTKAVLPNPLRVWSKRRTSKGVLPTANSTWRGSSMPRGMGFSVLTWRGFSMAVAHDAACCLFLCKWDYFPVLFLPLQMGYDGREAVCR